MKKSKITRRYLYIRCGKKHWPEWYVTGKTIWLWELWTHGCEMFQTEQTCQTVQTVRTMCDPSNIQFHEVHTSPRWMLWPPENRHNRIEYRWSPETLWPSLQRSRTVLLGVACATTPSVHVEILRLSPVSSILPACATTQSVHASSTFFRLSDSSCLRNDSICSRRDSSTFFRLSDSSCLRNDSICSRRDSSTFFRLSDSSCLRNDSICSRRDSSTFFRFFNSSCLRNDSICSIRDSRTLSRLSDSSCLRNDSICLRRDCSTFFRLFNSFSTISLFRVSSSLLPPTLALTRAPTIFRPIAIGRPIRPSAPKIGFISLLLINSFSGKSCQDTDAIFE